MKPRIAVALVLSILAVLACGGGSNGGTDPAPGSVTGTWVSTQLSFTLTQSGSNVSGSGSFNVSGGGCSFPVSGTYVSPTLTLGLGHVSNCAGSFGAQASGARLTGTLSFQFSPNAGLPPNTTTADITLIKQ